jgi:hypothetical protein
VGSVNALGSEAGDALAPLLGLALVGRQFAFLALPDGKLAAGLEDIFALPSRSDARERDVVAALAEMADGSVDPDAGHPDPLC